MLPIILAMENEQEKTLVAQIYDKYGKSIYAVAEKYLENKNDCEECVNDVFVIIIKKLDVFKELSALHQKNFLIKVCRCIAINKYKNNTRDQRLLKGEELEPSDVSESVEQTVISEESIKRLTKMLKGLDSKYSDVLYLKAFMQMSNKEIAESLGISENLVSVRLNRAKKLLLSKYGGEIDDIRRR